MIPRLSPPATTGEKHPFADDGQSDDEAGEGQQLEDVVEVGLIPAGTKDDSHQENETDDPEDPTDWYRNKASKPHGFFPPFLIFKLLIV